MANSGSGPDLTTFGDSASTSPLARRGATQGVKAPTAAVVDNGVGPDLSAFREKPRGEMLVEVAEAKMSSMRRVGSLGSQMWHWSSNSPSKTPSQSREGSRHGGSFFSPKSREGSKHGGSLFSPKSREGSKHGGSLWNWVTKSPPQSREGSTHAGDEFGAAGSKVKIKVNDTPSEANVMSNAAVRAAHAAKDAGPDLSSFGSETVPVPQAPSMPPPPPVAQTPGGPDLSTEREADAASMMETSMRRNGSIGSAMWHWVSGSAAPTSPRAASPKASNAASRSSSYGTPTRRGSKADFHEVQ